MRSVPSDFFPEQTTRGCVSPSLLRPGDTVGVVAPASPFAYDELTEGLRVLRTDWRLNVWEGDSLRANIGAFAGPDELRRADLQRLLDDPAVRAIFAARGGYGSYRLVEGLDFTRFLERPKWLVGFSDITVLLCHLQRLGVQSLHGIMPRQFGMEGADDSIDSLRRWLFGEPVAPYAGPPHRLNRPGTATGPLTGGNLSLLLHTLGTSSEVATDGHILFIEDIDETLFSLDRMLTQLRRAGKLANLAGLVVGQFTDMRNNASVPYRLDADEIIAEAVATYTYPVCHDFPVGHVARNLALPIGRPATLHVASTGGELSF